MGGVLAHATSLCSQTLHVDVAQEHLSQLEMERGVDDTNHPYYVLFGDGDDWYTYCTTIVDVLPR